MRVLLVDDHPLTAHSFKASVLAHLPQAVCHQVTHWAAAQTQLADASAKHQPYDWVVLDVMLQDETETQAKEALAERLAACRPALVWVMTAFADPGVQAVCDRHGAEYFHKSMEVMAIQLRIHQQLNDWLARQPLPQAMPLTNSHLVAELSPRQYEVVSLVAQGLTNKQIARQLQLSDATVHSHLHSASKVLNTPNRSKAAAMLLAHRATYGPREGGA